MPHGSYHQASFLGGEWAPEAQGRSDDPKYRAAMNVSLNGITVEAGAWVRRSGFLWLAPTYGRTTAKLIAFVPASTRPYVGEFTNTKIRFYLGTSLVFTTTTPLSVTGASYDSSFFTLTVASTTGWSVGDQVMLLFSAGYDPAKETGMRNRVLQITSKTSTTLVLGDDDGAAMTGFTLPTGGLVGASVYKVLRLDSSPWATAALPNLRAIQAGNQQVILSSSAAPQVISETSVPSAASMTGIDDRLYVVTSSTASDDYAVEVLRPLLGQTNSLTDSFFVDRGSANRAVVQAAFSLAAATFTDGPYAAAQPDTGTVSADTGTITFTPASSTFTSADVGKHIRLFSEPPAWASGTTYASGALVKYLGAYYQSTQGSNTGNFPGTPTLSGGVLTTFWAPALNVQRWVWGTISAQATTSCTVVLGTDISSAGGATNTIPSANGTTITVWQKGLYASGSWPSCGTFHEGRIWLAGASANRFDAGMSNGFLYFSPTDQYGNVNDNNAIDGTFNSPTQDQILWMTPDHQGVLCGTLGGEWLLGATQAGDPITPTVIQAHKVTEYQCANIEPRRTGMVLLFVQRYGRRLMEYLADTFSQRFSARHLNDYAQHLSASGIAEIAYQEEPAPIVWCRMNDGSLAGVTYRRVSRFVAEAPVFTAWHRHSVGGP